MTGQFRRLGELHRQSLTFELDGRPVEALEGDTLLVAMLINGRHLRQSEFGDGPRAGFCLMGACHDCMVWAPDGSKLRACSTFVEAGMRVYTSCPEEAWPARIA